MHARARNRQKRAFLMKWITVPVIACYVRVHARIIMKINMLIDRYIDSLSSKCYEDPFIGCWEIAETIPSMLIYPF